MGSVVLGRSVEHSEFEAVSSVKWAQVTPHGIHVGPECINVFESFEHLSTGCLRTLRQDRIATSLVSTICRQ